MGRVNSSRDRLIQAGAKLFAEKGFGGATVREICAEAETGVNMIHHNFTNKEGLLEAIVEEFSEEVFALPMRLLDQELLGKEDFAARMELLFSTTLDAFDRQGHVLTVVVRERADPPAFRAYIDKLRGFLENAKALGLVRQDLDSEMVTGFMLDRLLNHVLYATWIEKVYGVSNDGEAEQRSRWMKSNLSVFLYGVAT
jgi:AcrR family transcriptional regulator